MASGKVSGAGESLGLQASCIFTDKRSALLLSGYLEHQ